MSTNAPALSLDLSRARAHWHQRQGLAAPVAGALEAVVTATGWPRTLGGVEVYIALRARVPGLRRQTVDEAVAQSRLQVVPAVRGCIYLVPRAEVPLALRVAEELSRKRTERELQQLGVPVRELEEVGEAVLTVLAEGPRSTDALRRALPPGTVRSLGEKGKKVGVSSTLPAALRCLEFEGRIERTLESGRLDSERYAWRRSACSPFEGARVPNEAVERHAALAQVFFRVAGPARVQDFAEWSGLTKRDARAAMARAPLVPVAVQGFSEECFALEADLAVLRAPAAPSASVALVGFEDCYLVLHGGPASRVDPQHHGRMVAVWGSTKEAPLGEVRHLATRALLVDDRVAGAWEFDPDTGTVVWAAFEPLPAARRKAVDAAAEDLARFLRDDLGHAKSFSLDTHEEVRRRAAMVKAM
jgi:hypothetical protein